MVETQKVCLVIGGAGFIGSHTVDALLKAGYAVRVLDALQKRVHPQGMPPYVADRAEFIQGDACEASDLLPALKGVDYVYHLAAYQDYLPDFSTFIHVNAESTALLYELIVEHNLDIEKVVVASSQAVYGEGCYTCEKHGRVNPNMRSEEQLIKGEWEPVCPSCDKKIRWRPTDEETVNPQNQYAVSKFSQELIALTLGKRYHIPTVAMRYSIVQGPRQSFYNAYSGACRIFCLSLYFDQQPVLYEDGAQLRDYVNIHDVVDANLLVLNSHEADYQVFNVGGGQAYSVSEFAGIVADVYGKDSTSRIPGSYRFGDTRHIVSDIGKLKRLGWSPTRTPKDSVSEYVEWLREQESVEDILEFVENHMKKLNVVRQVSS